MSDRIKFEIKRVLISSYLANFLEFFDFTLFAFCAPFIARLYFPISSQKTSLLLVWAIFAISFIVRPIGAIFFGYIGDVYGRRVALISSIILMSVSTMFCGLVPTYSQWGILASIVLIVLRILQGLSVSAEYNGCSICIIENVTKYKGFLCSMASFSCGLGILTASLSVYLLTAGYSVDKLPQWRWRLPFVLGGLMMGIISYNLRRNMSAKRMQCHEKINPIKSLFKKEKTAFFASFFISSYNGVSAYVIYTYVVSYMQTHLSIPFDIALKFNAINTCLSIFSALIFGYISDFIGGKIIMFYAALCMAVFAIPMFILIDTGQPWSILLGFSFLSMCCGAFAGPMNAAIVEWFAEYNRYVGSSLSYNLGVACAGGSAPFIISCLLSVTNNHFVVPMYLMLFASLAMSALLVFERRTKFNFKPKAA